MEYKLVNYKSKLCSNINNKLHRQLLKLALKSLNQFAINSEILEKLKLENNINNEEFCDLMEMYISIINLYMKCNKDQFEEVLLSHGYSQEFIENLPLKYENKDDILTYTKNTQSTINKLNYRVDISLHNSVLNKIILPSVLFNLNYGDNKDVTFSVDSSTFHILRYNVALMVKELNALKNTSIMKK